MLSLNESPAPDESALPELLAAASRGDRDRFRSLYDATAPKLFALVLRITRNRAIAEEVLQETYVKVWQHAERFSPEAGKPMAWLATIARNRAIDRLRSERFDRFKDPGEDGMDILERIAADQGTEPGDRESVRHCLGELDDEARRCVVLAYCSGHSREELADEFNRPVGTIKTLLHRTIKLLRACMERE